MRKVWLLAWREYQAGVRTKAFLVMLVLAPIMMSGGLIAWQIVERQKDVRDKHIAIVDHTGRLAEGLLASATARNEQGIYDQQTGKKKDSPYILEFVTPNDEDPDAQRVELSDRVRRGELVAFVDIGPDVIHPQEDERTAGIAYHAENAALADARGWIDGVTNSNIRKLRAADAGMDAKTAEEVFNWRRAQPLGLVTVDAATGEVKDAERANEARAIAVPGAMMMLMFMMIMVGATPLVSAVLEEKMQRIAEVLLGSVRPFQLMLGKLLGSLAVSFTVMAIYLGLGITLLSRMDLMDYVPFHLLPWFFAYMVAAIFFFGALLTAMGAACNDLKEAQSLMMPVWMLVMIPMFVWIFVVKEPLSPMATWMSLIPPFTPILMLLRQATPVAIPAWQPWVGLAGVFVFTVLCVWVAGRIFRVGLLMQGKAPKMSDLARWAIRG